MKYLIFILTLFFSGVGFGQTPAQIESFFQNRSVMDSSIGMTFEQSSSPGQQIEIERHEMDSALEVEAALNQALEEIQKHQPKSVSYFIIDESIESRQVGLKALRNKVRSFYKRNKLRVQLSVIRGLVNLVPTSIGILLADATPALLTAAYMSAYSFLVPGGLSFFNYKLRAWVTRGGFIEGFMKKSIVSLLFNTFWLGVPAIIEYASGSNTMQINDPTSFVWTVLRNVGLTVAGSGVFELGLNRARNQLVSHSPQHAGIYDAYEGRGILVGSALTASAITAQLFDLDVKKLLVGVLFFSGTTLNVMVRDKHFEKLKSIVHRYVGTGIYSCPSIF